MLIELSIIVPIFNVEKYIIECLKSLLAKKPSNVEIILVNDGSKDNSCLLIKTMFSNELQAGELILLEQENQGVSVARNTGIAYAKGNYIGFVDADDLVLPNYFSAVLLAIAATRPDIVEIGWKTFVSNADLVNAEDHYVHSHFGLHPTAYLINDVFAASIWYPVIRFFKRELFSGHSFPAGVRFCEDMMMLHALYNKAATVYQVNEALYAYRINPMGATRNVSSQYADDIAIFYEKIIHLNDFHYRLLKINLFYLLFRCSYESETPLLLNANIQSNLKMIKAKPWLYKQVGIRKIIILLFPKLFSIWVNFKNKKLGRK